MGTPRSPAAPLDARDAALLRVAQWGRDIGAEPRNEGKIIDSIRAGRIGGDVELCIHALRAGRERVLVARAGVDALWNLAIDRDLHPPDKHGHGQLHLLNISLICEEGGIGEVLAAVRVPPPPHTVLNQDRSARHVFAHAFICSLSGQIDTHPTDAKVHEDGYAALAAVARGDRTHTRNPPVASDF